MFNSAASSGVASRIVTRDAPLPLAEYVTIDGTAVYSLFGPKVVGVRISGGTKSRSPGWGEWVATLVWTGSTATETDPTLVDDVDKAETVEETLLCFSDLMCEAGLPSITFSSGMSDSRSVSADFLVNCPVRMKFLIWERD